MSKETKLRNRVRQIVSGDRLADIRDQADKLNRYCFYRSMLEISYALGTTTIPRQKEVFNELLEKFGDIPLDALPPTHFFGVLEQTSDVLGLQIDKSIDVCITR